MFRGHTGAYGVPTPIAASIDSLASTVIAMSASIDSRASGDGYWNYQPSSTEFAKAADLGVPLQFQNFRD